MGSGPLAISEPRYLIVDVEATCSRDGAVPRNEMEIIEIGAVILERTDLRIAGTFQTFVRPVRHPVLTDFCRDLTTIRPDQVATAPGFPEALAAFREWSAGFAPWRFSSWGAYDRNQFRQDCAYHGEPYPFPEPHLNIKAAFSAVLDTPRRFGMGGALRELGLPLDGTHHRGLDDARNIARIVATLLRDPRPHGRA